MPFRAHSWTVKPQLTAMVLFSFGVACTAECPEPGTCSLSEPPVVDPCGSAPNSGCNTTGLPEGEIFVDLVQSPTAEGGLAAGESHVFEFNVQIVSNMDATFTLEPLVDLGWPVALVDPSNVPVAPSTRVGLAPTPDGVSQRVRVQVAIPAEAMPGAVARLHLRVAAELNPRGFSGISDGDEIIVADEPSRQLNLPVSLSTVARTTAEQPVPTTDEGVVRIGASTSGYRLTFLAELQPDTVYGVTLDAPTATEWTVSLSGADDGRRELTVGPFPMVTSEPIFVFVRASSGASDDALSLTITSEHDVGRVTQPIGLLPE